MDELKFRKFQENLNSLINWINNLNLDLIKHNSVKSSDQSPCSSKSNTPSPSTSTNNLVDAFVSLNLNTNLFVQIR